jgi:transposase
MEQRRLRAAELFAQGVRQADVARELGVVHQTVSDWYALWKEGGVDALRAGRPGRPPKLTEAQLAEVEQALARGPKANGFPTDLWTLARVAMVIEATTGVRYHPGHVWRILRERLGWSRQRPARRAVERDDEAIDRWIKERWPKVKKAPGAGARGLSSKTNPGSPSSPR